MLLLWAYPIRAEKQQIVRVADFGAIPDDGIDDTAAIQRAVAACGPGATLVFEKGTYDLLPKEGSRRPGYIGILLEGLKNFTIEGNGATLAMGSAGPSATFRAENCQNLTIRNMNFKTSEQTHLGGYVTATGDNYIDVRPTGPYIPREDVVEAVFGFDPQNMCLSGERLDVYQLRENMKARVMENGDLRVFLKNKIAMPRKELAVVVRYRAYGSACLSISHSTDVTLSGLNIYSVSGMGVIMDYCEDMVIKDCKVMIEPGSGLWLSANSDATHFKNCRGKIEISDCSFENMGDDAVNIHNFYSRVIGVVSPDSFTLDLNTRRITMPRVGDVLEIGTPDRGMVAVDSVVVKSIQTLDGGKLLITTQRKLPKKFGKDYVVGNATCTPRAIIRNCIVRGNRARGFLIQTRDVIVQGCTFDRCSAAAIHVTADVGYWCEGISTRNVTICDNKILGCNFSAASGAGAINIFASNGMFNDPAANETTPVHRNITISNNLFDDNMGYCINVSAAENVKITDNHVISMDKGFVNICEGVRGVEIKENTMP